MNNLYPAGPQQVPADLTRPGPAYRRHAWLAMGGLLTFVGLYFALLGWFGWTAWRLIGSLVEGSAGNPFEAALVGGCAAFMALFMAKALVFLQRGGESTDIELKPADQPQLFAFLHRLADEAGAPRPHRVYVSPRVNAAVFYDLSLANLLFPSRKNLEIGLALVNVLNLSEFKAVLAHEFGHFAQRTMAVGRWVYMAQQIAGHIIARRDAFDSLLQGLSRIDLRVAWIGWILRLVVWSVRSLVELMFRLVALGERALSREMEFQADLVSASLAGSDALVHALHKLHAADLAWHRALGFAESELRAGHGVADLFALQTRVIERLRQVFADPHFGAAPEIPAGQEATHRVFKRDSVLAPQMWATHPPAADREHNVKRRYVAAAADPRTAWLLFEQPQALRTQMIGQIYKGELPPPAPLEQSLQRLDQEFERPTLDRRYRGNFLNRSIVRHANSVDELYVPIDAQTNLQQHLASLYGDDHDLNLDRLRELREDLDALRALEGDRLHGAGGLVHWRGRALARRELPRALAELQREIEPVAASVQDHDARCRSLHLHAARQLGRGWDGWLDGLTRALHYAEHTLADLRDAQGLVANTYAVVTADGKVSAAELRRLVTDCNMLHGVLAGIHAGAAQIRLGTALSERLGVSEWAAALEEFKLPSCSQDNIDPWLKAIDGWVNATANALSGLRDAALDLLVSAEATVARALQTAELPDSAPQAPQFPASYATLVTGQERKRQQKLGWWDQFQTASGLPASMARLTVAGAIVSSVLLLGAYSGHQKLSVHNGLGRPVLIEVAGQSLRLLPNASAELKIDRAERLQVSAHTEQGELIESFTQTEQLDGKHLVYNVAGAAPLISWTATYGNAQERPSVQLGAPRWLSSSADHVFTEPPETVRAQTGGSTRSVVSAVGDEAISEILDAMPKDADPSALISAHARWDAAHARGIHGWLLMASGNPEFEQLLKARLDSDPLDIATRRIEQDLSRADVDRHAAVCEEHRRLAEGSPQDANLRYLVLRCMSDDDEQDAAFADALRQTPDNPWLKFAVSAAHSYRGHWADAGPLHASAMAGLPQMRDHRAVDQARMLRALEGKESAQLAALAGTQPTVQWYLELDRGQAQGGGNIASYEQLRLGNLAQALQGTSIGATDTLALLIAASVDAPPEHVQAMLIASQVDSDNPTALWPAVALAIREGADPSIYVDAALNAMAGDDGQAIQRFLWAVADGADPGNAAAHLGYIEPTARGIAYSSATTLLGDRTPVQWKEEAGRLLFSFERPYRPEE